MEERRVVTRLERRVVTRLSPHLLSLSQGVEVGGGQESWKGRQ